MTTFIVTQPTYQVAVQVDGAPTVMVNVPAPVVIDVRETGTQGPPGQSGDLFAIVAGEAISALRVLSQSNGQAMLCNPASLGSVSAVIGVSLTAAAMGASVQVRRVGVVSDASWTWVVGFPVFCGSAGALTQSAPTSVAVRQIGVATSPTEILIDLSETIIVE